MNIVVTQIEIGYLKICQEIVNERLDLERMPGSTRRDMEIMKWQVRLNKFGREYKELRSKIIKNDTAIPVQSWFGSFQHGRVADDATGLLAASVLQADPAIQHILGENVDIYDLNQWVAAVHPDDIDRLIQAQVEAEEHHTPFEVEYRYYNDTLKAWRIIRCSSMVQLDDQGVEVYHGVMMDLTEMRRFEQKVGADEKLVPNVIARRAV